MQTFAVWPGVADRPGRWYDSADMAEVLEYARPKPRKPPAMSWRRRIAVWAVILTPLGLGAFQLWVYPFYPVGPPRSPMSDIPDPLAVSMFSIVTISGFIAAIVVGLIGVPRIRPYALAQGGITALAELYCDGPAMCGAFVMMALFSWALIGVGLGLRKAALKVFARLDDSWYRH